MDFYTLIVALPPRFPPCYTPLTCGAQNGFEHFMFFFALSSLGPCNITHLWPSAPLLVPSGLSANCCSNRSQKVFAGKTSHSPWFSSIAELQSLIVVAALGYHRWGPSPCFLLWITRLSCPEIQSTAPQRGPENSGTPSHQLHGIVTDKMGSSSVL